MTLRQYAEKRGIQYFTAWRHLKAGRLKARKRADGTYLVLRAPGGPLRPGKPPEWTEEKVVREVYRLCKGRYVKASGFPPYLYKLCRKFCGSVRSAKWKAKIMHGRHWTYEKFMKCVAQFCARRYREEKDWPPNLRSLARRYCGSIRKAKWEAGVIRDRRRKVRRSHGRLENLWTRGKFLGWVGEFCGERYRKTESWPGYMRELAGRYCGSIRKAKQEAGVLRDMRGRKSYNGPMRVSRQGGNV